MSNQPSAAAGPPKPPAKKIRPEDLGNKPLVLSNPQHVAEFADVLSSYIKNNSLSTIIQGKQYVNVEGWKFAAINFGLTVVCKKPVRLDAGKIVYNFYEKYIFMEGTGTNQRAVEKERIWFSGTDKDVSDAMAAKVKPFRIALTELYLYECEADLISMKTGQKIGYGYALCSNAETKKASFDQFAIASMAQTRTIGKTVKNLLGFVMNAAGFENTPVEEMDEEKYSRKVQEPGTEQARLVPDGGLDITTEMIIRECNTVPELEKIWDQNPHLHAELIFQQAMTKRKLEIVKPVKK